jgi:threonine/homoserine/homoserine lactone efflux protein
MQHLPELIGMASALTLGAVSPGPSFVMVARTAASVGRRNGLLAALGMGLGVSFFRLPLYSDCMECCLRCHRCTCS